MRSMVEGFFGVCRAPPPPFGWSPSPANGGEELALARLVFRIVAVVVVAGIVTGIVAAIVTAVIGAGVAAAGDRVVDSGGRIPEASGPGRGHHPPFLDRRR